MNINGIIITEQAIEKLRELQADNNANLKYYIGKMNSISKKLIMDKEDCSDNEKTLGYVANLFAICEIMECLFAQQKGGAA